MFRNAIRLASNKSGKGVPKEEWLKLAAEWPLEETAPSPPEVLPQIETTLKHWVPAIIFSATFMTLWLAKDAFGRFKIETPAGHAEAMEVARREADGDEFYCRYAHYFYKQV